MDPRSSKLEPTPKRPRPIGSSPKRRWLFGLLVLAGMLFAALTAFRLVQPSADNPSKKASAPVPIVAAIAEKGDLPVYQTGLGTATAFRTVTVRSRVDGELVRVAFKEGQTVREGELLAEIDPRPYQVQLTQAEGQMARDQAQLEYARLQLARDRALLEKNYVPRQQVESDTASLSQFEGALKTDQGQIDNARLQLTYTRIKAPFTGRIGLRLVDAGNIVRANDPTGLAVITQLQPIAVLFNLPQDSLQPIMARLRTGQVLPVEAYDRDLKHRIAAGSLLTTDNVIDANTGTLRFKAVFPNDDNMLFPNQFVNARLLVETLRDRVIIPTAAIQRGPGGTYVYVILDGNTAAVRTIVRGPSEGERAVIDKGLEAGEMVVIDGVDRLRDGTPVAVTLAETPVRKLGLTDR